jgi:nucleoside-diphosphate-sugar epimerase
MKLATGGHSTCQIVPASARYVPFSPPIGSRLNPPTRQLRRSSELKRERAMSAYLSSTIAASSSSTPSSNHLLVVGPGVLGSYLGKLWLDEHGPSTVVGQTNTTSSHEKLQRIGITPRTNADAQPNETFPFVAFAAPPSGSEDYLADVKAALARWDGSGGFVFTSSASVYAVEDGSPCDESAPLVPLGANERTDRLLLSEQAVMEAGGCVVRLVGLYHRTRGAHTFFLKQGQVQRWGDYCVNLIHYEDAAGLAAAVLKGQGGGGQAYRGRAFLGCDGSPVTFRSMMDAIEASGQLPGHVEFTGAAGPSKGKRMSNLATREQLRWQPKYTSITEFFAGGARDWYSESEGLAPVGAAHA